MKILTNPTPVGWYAYDADTFDGAEDAGPQRIGGGLTEAEAIADLEEQIEGDGDAETVGS